MRLVNADYIGGGDEFSCPYMYLWNPIDVGAAGDGGTEIIVGPPFAFTPDNIAEWKTVY